MTFFLFSSETKTKNLEFLNSFKIGNLLNSNLPLESLGGHSKIALSAKF